MTSISGKGYDLPMRFGDNKEHIINALSKFVSQSRDDQILGTEVIAINKVDSQFCGLKELVVFYIGSEISVTAQSESRFHAVTA